MNISKCIDEKIVGGCKSPNSLQAQTNDELELLHEIAKFIYETKSIRRCIEIISKSNKSK